MKIVVALGGNALGNNPEEQKILVDRATDTIIELIEQGHEILISHGNGPQVGMILDTFQEVSKKGKNTFEMPFPEAVAMSQAYIGYHIQNSLNKKLRDIDLEKGVVSLVTQVVVDEKDQAFKEASKPIGSFYKEEEALSLKKLKDYEFIEDSGRGYRRVVPSPKPVEIVELEIIKDLWKKGNIVIAAGGGGIPVCKKNGKLIGVDAVIDKDLSAAKLAIDLKADFFIILTAVEKVAINFNKENEEYLDKLNIDDIDRYISQDEFGKGSMLPKIIAARDFVCKTNRGKAIITNLSANFSNLNNVGSLISKN